MNILNIKDLQNEQPIYVSKKREIYAYKELSIVDVEKISDLEELNQRVHTLLLNSNHDFPHIFQIKGFYISQEYLADNFNEESSNQNSDSKPIPTIKLYGQKPEIQQTLFEQLMKRSDSRIFYKFEGLIEMFSILANAVAYLHTKKIIHGNINPYSACFDMNGNLKLGGINSKHILDPQALKQSFDAYIPPEELTTIFEKNDRGDIWSLGILFLQLATLEKIHNKTLSKEEIERLLGDVNLTYTPELTELLRNMLHQERLKRWDIFKCCKFIEEKLVKNYSLSFKGIYSYKIFAEFYRVNKSFCS